MTGIEEAPSPVKVVEVGVLEKFDGEGTSPQNLVERVHVKGDGEGGFDVVKVEFFEAGEKVGEQIVEEGGTN